MHLVLFTYTGTLIQIHYNTMNVVSYVDTFGLFHLQTKNSTSISSLSRNNYHKQFLFILQKRLCLNFCVIHRHGFGTSGTWFGSTATNTFSVCRIIGYPTFRTFPSANFKQFIISYAYHTALEIFIFSLGFKEHKQYLLFLR